MARCHLILACLALSAIAAAQGRVMLEGASSSRSLQQFNASPFCADGCDLVNNGCIQDATRGGLRCQKCLGDLMVNKVTGNCACPAGKYAVDDGASYKCQDCPKGSFCLGSDFYKADNPNSPIANTGLLAPQPTPCPTGSDGSNMTTLGKRSTSQRACVNQPGTYYTIETAANGLTTIGQVLCPIDTYSAGLKKQRACVPCPTGYTTNGVTGAKNPTACVVPAGYYLKGPGQVAQCPKGEYKEGTGTAGNCTKCAFGVTTVSDASISQDNCTQVVAGYYAAAMTGAVVTATKPCPQKYYCPGGTPTRVFTPASPNADAANVTTGTIFLCPKGTWTQEVASTAVEQCMTPPGYYNDGTTTTKCVSGAYRADWKPYTEVNQCTSCGEGVKAVATDRVVLFNILDAANTTNEAITTSSDDCYVMPGQGLYFTTLTNTWRAKNCTDNAYGVANITYGLTPAPCRDCPKNMVTSIKASNASFPNSATFYTSSGDTQGFIDDQACVTQDGFGYNGRGSQACTKGTYNNRDNYEDCKACPYGFTTEGVGKGFTLASCGVAQGFGSYADTMLPCPIGTYNDVDWNTTKGPCKTCPDGLTTAVEGATSVTQCNMCQPGRGGANCTDICGGAVASYGPIGRSVDTNPNCTMCTTQDTGFSFDWNLQNDIYASPAVSRAYANASTDCVSQYSQLIDGAWYIPMASNDQYTKTVVNVSTFADCAAMCTKSVSVSFYATPVECEFVTYDYQAKTCAIRTAVPPTYVGAPLIAFKNLPSGDVGTNAWSVNHKKAKASGVTTGVYTFYREEGALDVGITQVEPQNIAGAGLGPVTNGTSAQNLQDCLNRCDDYRFCAGITIKMNVVVSDRPTTCMLILGNTQVGTFKRTVMRADPTRMPLPNMTDLATTGRH